MVSPVDAVVQVRFLAAPSAAENLLLARVIGSYRGCAAALM